jgi:putative ABC transport system ATP-binding protein
LIATKNLTFQYPGESKLTFPDIDFTDQHLLIQGASGSGKTTLLHLLAGLLEPHSGSIEILQCDFSTLKAHEKETFRNLHFGIAPQSPAFVASLKMGEYLRLIQAQMKRKVGISIQEALDALNLQHLTHKKPDALSGGEKQRFGLVVALLRQPKILFADEPTAALDEKNAQSVMDVLLHHATQQPFQLVVVSHDQRIANRLHQTIRL